jgi:hypothetical protein
MPKGITYCRFCQRRTPSLYRKHHEKQCKARRGLEHRQPRPLYELENKQRRLNEYE